MRGISVTRGLLLSLILTTLALADVANDINNAIDTPLNIKDIPGIQLSDVKHSDNKHSDIKLADIILKGNGLQNVPSSSIRNEILQDTNNKVSNAINDEDKIAPHIISTKPDPAKPTTKRKNKTNRKKASRNRLRKNFGRNVWKNKPKRKGVQRYAANKQLLNKKRKREFLRRRNFPNKRKQARNTSTNKLAEVPHRSPPSHVNEIVLGEIDKRPNIELNDNKMTPSVTMTKVGEPKVDKTTGGVTKIGLSKVGEPNVDTNTDGVTKLDLAKFVAANIDTTKDGVTKNGLSKVGAPKKLKKKNRSKKKGNRKRIQQHFTKSAWKKKKNVKGGKRLKANAQALKRKNQGNFPKRRGFPKRRKGKQVKKNAENTLIRKDKKEVRNLTTTKRSKLNATKRKNPNKEKKRNKRKNLKKKTKKANKQLRKVPRKGNLKAKRQQMDNKNQNQNLLRKFKGRIRALKRSQMNKRKHKGPGHGKKLESQKREGSGQGSDTKLIQKSDQAHNIKEKSKQKNKRQHKGVDHDKQRKGFNGKGVDTKPIQKSDQVHTRKRDIKQNDVRNI